MWHGFALEVSTLFSNGVETSRIAPLSYLFEIEEISLTLVLPETRHVVGQTPGLLWPPVFHESSLIRRDNAVVSGRILRDETS